MTERHAVCDVMFRATTPSEHAGRLKKIRYSPDFVVGYRIEKVLNAESLAAQTRENAEYAMKWLSSWYKRLPRLPDTPVWNFVRRALVLVFGLLVLLIGIAMIVLPGPAIVMIPLGLAILATEFLWARRLLLSARRQARRLRLQRFLRSLDRAKSEVGSDSREQMPRAG